MSDINIETYFKENENKYYDPNVITRILEDILGKSIGKIKKEVTDSKIVVTSEQIKSFLEYTFTTEDPELKKRIESPRPKRSSNISGWSVQDIKDSSQELSDDIAAGRYCFEPYTLEYFERYITIVRDKAVYLLGIIEKISNKNTQDIQEILNNLDIVLDENSNILKNDIMRLIEPTLYNINDLNNKVTEANDLSTYLNFKLSKHYLLRNGITEGEIYPTSSIQVNDLVYGYKNGNVPLSANQRDILIKKRVASIDYFTNLLLK